MVSYPIRVERKSYSCASFGSKYERRKLLKKPILDSRLEAGEGGIESD